MSRRGSEIRYPRFNVIFLCDTGAPNTYLCEETLNTMLGNPEHTPSSMRIHLANFPAVEAHLSPPNGHYTDVNVIGMDLLSKIQTTIYGADFFANLNWSSCLTERTEMIDSVSLLSSATRRILPVDSLASPKCTYTDSL
ncbi:hypothetical protein IV203_010868 [Nitzschia inconspicua]|uniref:Uncharacterized protein n=1 Tax=Nitzschia inconspicua TaxID=303405 RepID=A0A9K3PLB7_9STRA|nr:hypothetical protein IV203_010868 [Nitzschia inconspicua]